MIINGDLFDIVPDFADNSIDLVITSPPYFDFRNYGNVPLFDDVTTWQIFCRDALLLLKEKIKPGGVIWWNTASGYKDGGKMTNVYRLIGDLEDRGLYLVDEIPWCKTSGPPKRFRNRPPAMWEHNYILAKNPSAVTFYHDNVRQPYAPATIERMKYKVSNLHGDLNGEFTERKKVEPHPLGRLPYNYLLLPQDTTARPHPATMNPALANWAIRAYTRECDWVLDPMAGIGTTWIECLKLNRQFIGVELFEEYIEIAKFSVERYKEGKPPYLGLKRDWKEKNNE